MSAFLAFLFFVVPFLAVVIFGVVIYTKVKSSARRLFGTSSISELVDFRDAELENTPKSINGMEQLELPKIKSDFPKMSVDELKARDIDEIYAYYHAIDTADYSRYSNNDMFNDRMKMIIKQAGQNAFSISNIKIHRQAISSYSKTEDGATIEIQTAFEGTKRDAASAIEKKHQLRVQTQWVYLMDDGNFNNEMTTTLNCPNCGAPLHSLNSLVCEHCGSEITIDYNRSWRLSSLMEC